MGKERETLEFLVAVGRKIVDRGLKEVNAESCKAGAEIIVMALREKRLSKWPSRDDEAGGVLCEFDIDENGKVVGGPAGEGKRVSGGEPGHETELPADPFDGPDDVY